MSVGADSVGGSSLSELFGSGGGGGGGAGYLETPVTGIVHESADETASMGINVTGSSIANTKGSFVEMIASTASAATGIIVTFHRALTATQQFMLFDLAIGAASSESVIIPNIPIVIKNAESNASYFFPIAIDAGTRISMRHQHSAVVVTTLAVSVTLLSGGSAPTATAVQNYGADTAVSSGTRIEGDAASAIHTKTAWAELTPSTSDDISLAYFCMAAGTPNSSNSTEFLVDFATGGAGSEVVLAENLAISTDVNTRINQAAYGPIPISVPAGTRLSYRFQSSLDSATSDCYALVMGIT
jgi:hypothetical protein